MVGSFVRDRADISEFNLDIEAFLRAQVVELVVDVVSVTYIALQAEDSETFEHLGLMDHRVQVVTVVQNAGYGAVSLLQGLAGELIPGGLGVEVWRLKYLWALQNLGLDCVWLKGNF